MIDRTANYIPQQYLYHLGEDGSVVGKTKIQPRKLEGVKEEQLPPELPFSDLVETIWKQEAAAAATPNPYGDAAIARIGPSSVTKWYDFEPTGDEEVDRIMQLGYDYRKSCYDYTNSGDFAAMTAAEDFTGMTKAEIYKSIYEKYQHCYGENFYDSIAISYFEQKYDPVFRQFEDEIYSALGDHYYSSTVQKARREALYGDMNDYEVRKTIMEKYMENGNITLRNLFKALNEMDACGVGGEMMSGLNRPTNFGDGTDSIFDSLSQTESMLARERNMDQYVTPKLFQQLQRFCESHVNSCGGNPKKVAAINQIIEMCNGGYGSTGSSSGFVSKAAIEEMFSRMGYTGIRF